MGRAFNGELTKERKLPFFFLLKKGMNAEEANTRSLLQRELMAERERKKERREALMVEGFEVGSGLCLLGNLMAMLKMAFLLLVQRSHYFSGLVGLSLG